ncbi:MAG: T9SS type A sorting domain-containing protein [Saprospiraceae bacterium]|nr:T9SS type A sorting domain-containing protein [Saprospiraceae bacterium]
MIFRVFDCHNNYNDCMVNVEVQDKSGPSITCPPNVSLFCGQDYTNPTLVGTVETDPTLQGPLDGLAIDNCGANITVTQSDAGTVACGAGTIYRTYAATDPAGTLSFCVQTITVINNNPFTGANINFPADITLNGCNAPTTPATTGSPTFPAPNGCHTLVSGYTDLPLTNAPDACLKILRTWSVIDWCQYDVNNPSAGGIWTDVQVIKVMDGVGPTFASCANRTFCNFKDDCSPLAPDLSVNVSDLCTPTNQITLTWTVDLNDDGIADPGFTTMGTGQNSTNNYPIGTHRISYRATDGCGNASFCNYLFTIEDCKAPTPVCANGLVVEIMPSGMVQVNASSLLDPSTRDNCSTNNHLQVSFSPDVTDLSNIYTCDDLGQNVVEIWVTDEDGNADFCQTFVEIQDNMGACTGVPLIAVSGRIANESNLGLENANVELNGNMAGNTTTGANGTYQFNSLPIGFDYTVTPSLNSSPLNGVTTFDLLLTNQHILGSVPFDSPYKLIAADANRNGSVTVSDIVELRKLILHVTDLLPNNSSWRFVDANYTFPNPSNPFAGVFPEVCNINDLAPTSPSVNFIAIKVGDVNGTAVTSLNAPVAEDRNAMDYSFKVADRKFDAGEMVTVNFDANLAGMLGYQFTLSFDKSVLQFENLTPTANTSVENFGLNQLEKGFITTSWYQLAAEKMGADETQFSLTFKALKSGKLSDLLNINSSQTIAESYEKGGVIRPVVVEFENQNGATVFGNQFELYQNIPNPFTGETIIRFQLPVASNASLTIYNVEGKAIKTVSGDYAKGYHEITIEGGSLPTSGVFYYRLQTPGYTATRKMTLLD